MKKEKPKFKIGDYITYKDGDSEAILYVEDIKNNYFSGEYKLRLIAQVKGTQYPWDTAITSINEQHHMELCKFMNTPLWRKLEGLE